MDFFEAVDRRYSYRGEFQDRPVPEEDLHMILEAGIKAPSGLNKQTTTFVAVTDPQLRAGLNEIFPHKGIASAPVTVVVLSSHREIYEGMAFEVQDYSAAVENMLLAATALGYATVWTDGETHSGDRQKRIAELLNVPADRTVRALLPIGIPVSEGRQAKKLPLEERVQFNKF